MDLECKRCLYKWVSKVKKPKQCPNCKQYYYDKDREWVKQTPINIGAEKTEEEKMLGEKEPSEEEIKRSIEELKDKGELNIF